MLRRGLQGALRDPLRAGAEERVNLRSAALILLTLLAGFGASCAIGLLLNERGWHSVLLAAFVLGFALAVVLGVVAW